MARPLRVEFPGAIYHVTCRMIGDHRFEQSPLFVDDHDRRRFLSQLGDRVGQYHIRMFLFVLMSNHFHLVFETPEGNCSRFMQSLTTAYTVYYNKRHRRHGHLFDGRYKAKLVEGDRYLLALSRYVHLNPVRVSSTGNKMRQETFADLHAYQWSSFLSYIGKQKLLNFLDYAPILAMTGVATHQQTKEYRAFVEAGLTSNDEDFKDELQRSPRSIGSETFRIWIDDLHHRLTSGHYREDISFRHITEPLPPDTILETVAEILDVETESFLERRRNSPLRAIAATMLVRYAGQTQREVAALLGMGTGGAVSLQCRKLPKKLSNDVPLKEQFEMIRQVLEKRRRENISRAS